MSDRLAAIRAAPALDPAQRSYLRLVRADRADADFIAGLRNDPVLNRHLNAPPTDPEAQLRWLSAYEAREAAGEEFYFAIVCDGCDKGVVRLYDFRAIDGRSSFAWGSWIIAPPAVPGLAVWSLLLALGIGFDILRYTQSHFDVRLGNDKCRGLYARMGASVATIDPPDMHLTLSRSAFAAFRAASTCHAELHGVPR